MRLIYVFIVLLVLIPFTSATDLDLVISAQLNGMNAEFEALTSNSASQGFDGFDLPALPTLTNSSQLYSVICSGTSSSCKLIVDAWSAGTNPRTLNLVYQVNPAQTGTLGLSWSFSNPDFIVVLKDYGSDSTRTNQVGGDIDMSTRTVYSSSHSGALHYYKLIVTNVSSNPADTTPPGAVTQLNVKSNTSSSITWNWTNPTVDFSQAILYLQGINVQNTSGNEFIAPGLSIGSYTLRVNTKDASGNINHQNETKTFTLYVGNTAVNNTVVNNTNNTNNNTIPKPPVAPPQGQPAGPGDQGPGSDTGADNGIRGGNDFFNNNFFGNDTEDIFVEPDKSNLLKFFSGKATIFALSALVLVLAIVIIVVIVRVLRTARQLKSRPDVKTH